MENQNDGAQPGQAVRQPKKGKHFKQGLQILHDLCRVSKVHPDWKQEMISMFEELEQVGHQEACAIKIFSYVMRKNSEAEADKMLRSLKISPEIYVNATIFPPA